MLENKRSVNTQQFELILDSIESSPGMALQAVLETTRCNMFDENWNELVEKLNQVPRGAKRGSRRWKVVLSDWKMKVKAKANAENMENPEPLTDMDNRLLRLVQEEEGVDQGERTMADMFFLDAETVNVFGRPRTLIRKDRSEEENIFFDRLERNFNNARRDQCMTTLIKHTTPEGDENSRKMMMQMHLDRLHRVSQQLESHIQDVQNRIQSIKDKWQHDCNGD